MARTLENAGKPEEARQVLLRCLQDNPASKLAHFEMAQFYMRYPKDRETEQDLILDHLRRSFTAGDRNYDAQFWYARQAFLSGKFAEATAGFKALRDARVPAGLMNQVRGIITDGTERSGVYVGEVAAIEPGYMFVRSPEFSERVFVHWSKAAEDDWDNFRRGDRVAFTVGFNMRGPTAASIRRLESAPASG